MPRIAQSRQAFPILDLKTLDDAQGTFSGYLAVFNNVDLGDDVIEPGSFAKTLTEARERKAMRNSPYLFPILYQHEQAAPCGGFTDAHEDSHGLYVKGQLDLDTQLGRDTYSGLKKGYLSGLSIGYSAIKHKWVGDVRHLQELALYEGSVVTFPMNPAAQVGMVKSEDTNEDTHEDTHEDKAASQADKDEQEARAKKYGIGIKPGGAVTKPSQWDSLTDADFGDPVNYAYPMPDKGHADDAAGRFMAPDAQAVYTAKEREIVAKRIMAKQTSYGEKPDWWPPKDDGKGANVTRIRRMTRAAATLPNGQPVKALDFSAALQQVSADDQLQDDWGDSFQAFVNAMCSVMCQAVYGAGMGDDFDGQAAAETVLAQFSDHMAALVKQSIAASFVPALDDDGDSFLDPDGPNADDDDDSDSYSSMGMMSASTPRAQKAGRTLSADNHAMMTKALGMIGEGHKALSEFVKSNAPANASAADPVNPGDEPPGASDNVYDPAFGKSSPAAAAPIDLATAYAHRAGALAAYRPALSAAATPLANANASRAGAQASADGQSKATAATTQQQQRSDVDAGRNDDDDDDGIAAMRALLAQMRDATTVSREPQPVAAQ